jgi:hypothetical protein
VARTLGAEGRAVVAEIIAGLDTDDEVDRQLVEAGR